MVDIDNEILEALTDIEVPIFGYMPDFGDDEPSDYIVYTYYDTPQLFADNTEHAYEYSITIHIFTQSINPVLECSVKKKMKHQGFAYQGSTSRDDITTYPGKHRKNQEYKITVLEEE